MRYLFGLLYLLISFACQSPTQPENVDEPNELQNVLIIIGDDHSANVLGAYGNNVIKTPNLDRMAARGVRFNRAYANAPLCSASRQSLITGRYPHATGVTLLRTSFPEEQVTIADHLKDEGYVTGIIGKNHFNNRKNHGFDVKIERKDYYTYLEDNPGREVPDSVAVRPQWKPFRDPARIWLNADALPGNHYDADDIGTWYSQRANQFLTDHQDTSFCLVVGFHEPHSPFNFPIEYAQKYDPANMPLPQGSPEDDQWVPQIFQDLTEEERQGIVSAYYASTEYLDKNIGLILNKLDSLGLAENTIVVYLGDHGYLLNDHKRFEKHMMWEPAVQAPLLMQAVGHLPEGEVLEPMAEFVDVVPTLLEAIQAPSLASVQGKSLLPLIQQENNTHKNYVFSEFLADNKAMVRSDHWKYIFTTGKRDLAQGYATGNPAPGITHRLYDMINDPNETKNLYADPVLADTVRHLQSQLINWFRQTHPDSDTVSPNETVEQQLVSFCEPPDENANVGAQ
ncbi:MAG: sulfatase-like hydrolase/transferase [Tunicatimonas sp.]|uniref:sulfatase family protein n=1 Tax=Tunicatimonas sp. TaxID=1940096 RepID=UPI003C7464E9